MAIEALIIWLIVGAIAGWLAGQVIKGGGFGLVGDIILGIVGALVAGWLLPQLGILIGGGILVPSSMLSSVPASCCSSFGSSSARAPAGLRGAAKGHVSASPRRADRTPPTPAATHAAIANTGAFVALLDRGERHHGWAAERLAAGALL